MAYPATRQPAQRPPQSLGPAWAPTARPDRPAPARLAPTAWCKSMAIHSQVINCSASELAAMIEGAMRHGTSMEVDGNYVDFLSVACSSLPPMSALTHEVRDPRS